MTATIRTTDALQEGLIEVDGREYYAIPDVDSMRPFLMSIVSNGDRWMFVSSSGGLTAGRRDSSRALFPYETDDRLHRAAAGPATAFRIHTPDGDFVWRPFYGLPTEGARRHLYKSVVGDSVIFEEAHRDAGLLFRYTWASTDLYGFVRRSELTNLADDSTRVDIIDGLVGILPAGVDPLFHQTVSNLSNAYRRSEIIDPELGLAVFSLESAIVDRPEPEEVLRATVVWSSGLESAAPTLDVDAVGALVRGAPMEPAPLVTGRAGAYLLDASIDLEPGSSRSWRIVADVGVDQPALIALRRTVREMDARTAALDDAVGAAHNALVGIMAPADAMQKTGDEIATAHHFSNVTFNVLRGGVPLSGYEVTAIDLRGLVTTRNKAVARRHAAWFEALPERLTRRQVLELAAGTGDPQLERLCNEYIPFAFSRRHGDPSRPWNKFSIRLRDDEGRPLLYYEGNWRDIFQNWEALASSFPEYLPGMIAAFLNASTADGYNPYRITRDGIDWEVPDEHDPWANIGYWGDHQIVYLLRLLESAERHLPGHLEDRLAERRHTYADVPYRIAPYERLVEDPKATIEFDDEAAAAIARRVAAAGTDGRLMWADDGPLLVTLLEKLLVPALAKLSNFVPDGGIWMNTQRPEWNDANNALVGYGLSMVTLYELRRYLAHLHALVVASDVTTVGLSTEVAQWLEALAAVFARDSETSMSPASRKAMMDALGSVYSEYRWTLYASGFSDVTDVSTEEITSLCEVAISHLDATILGSRRADGLFHSYNLISFSQDRTEAEVEHLYEMLEGQVAILESGLLAPHERADVVDALYASDIYRPDQDSFMLYPARRPPQFLEKNVIPTDAIQANPLLRSLLERGDTSVVVTDEEGAVRFDADLTSSEAIEAALDELATDPGWADAVARHRSATMTTYREVFGHHAYTGRSGSMYGYEGLGSIYWHMVAKLLVAVQRSVVEAERHDAAPDALERLRRGYWRIRGGLGFNKAAAEHGAIPIDPYSHTPAHSGAQQPGMTGLVKEELLTRWLEVGLEVDAGEIRFTPLLLRPEELVDEPTPWTYIDVDGAWRTIDLPPGSLGFTLCQLPVVVERGGDSPLVTVHRTGGGLLEFPGSIVPADVASEVFGRTGAFSRIHALLPPTR